MYIPKKLRSDVMERANKYCEYCYALSSFSPGSFVVDHIFPQVLGGQTVYENLAFCCSDCNGHKYQKTHYIDPFSQTKVPLFHPRNDFWPDHFQWNEDETLILGISPTGRATIDLLAMNREGNINLRILLQLVGMHPPNDYILR